jgi:hypothetical protein
MTARFNFGSFAFSVVRTTISPSEGISAFKKKLKGAKSLHPENGVAKNIANVLSSSQRRISAGMANPRHLN